MICLGLHSNVMLRFLVQALCSRTVYDVDEQLQDGAEGGECASGVSSASQPKHH